MTFSKTFYRHRENVYYTCHNHSLPPSINQTIRCLNGNLSAKPSCQSSRLELLLQIVDLAGLHFHVAQCTVPHMLFLRNIANTTRPSGAILESGSSFDFTCMQDYQPLTESTTVECGNDGQLSHEAQCVPVSCKQHPPGIDNGRTIFHSTKHGSIAKYRCLPGYQMENNHLTKVTCQFGQWLPKQPSKCLPSNDDSLLSFSVKNSSSSRRISAVSAIRCSSLLLCFEGERLASRQQGQLLTITLTL